MGVSPSGTDINELKSAASTGPYYLSVIVNNRLDINALVAIKHTYKGKIQSKFKNLFGKYVNSKAQDIEYEEYEIIECEVEKQYPQYMLDINNRIATKLQNYSESAHPKRFGNTKKKKEEVVQLEAFPVEGYTSLNEENDFMSEELLKTFIPEALDMYCTYNTGEPKIAKIAAQQLIIDRLDYGIPKQYYINYLKKEEFKGADYTKELIKELEIYGK